MNFVRPAAHLTPPDNLFKIDVKKRAKKSPKQNRMSHKSNKKKENIDEPIESNKTAESQVLELSQSSHVSSSSKLSMTPADTDTTCRPELPVIKSSSISKVRELVPESKLPPRTTQIETPVPEAELPSKNNKGRVTQTVVTQAAVASEGLAQATQRVTSAAEWTGAGILQDAISRPWYPKEFIQEGEPTTAHDVYEGLSKYMYVINT